MTITQLRKRPEGSKSVDAGTGVSYKNWIPDNRVSKAVFHNTFLRKRLIRGWSITIWQVLVFLVTFGLIAGLGYYQHTQTKINPKVKFRAVRELASVCPFFSSPFSSVPPDFFFTDCSLFIILFQISGYVFEYLLPFLFLPLSRNPNGLFPYLFASSWEYLLEFHKFMGHILVLLVSFHGVMCTVMFYLATKHSWAKTWKILKTWKNLTGIISLGAFLLLWISAFTPLRRKYKYEIFHCLHVIFTVGAVVFMFYHVHHPALTWKILIVPAIFWGLDLLWRFYTSFFSGRARVVSKQVLPNSHATVIELDATNEKLFSFEPGQWAYICLPSVSRVEFHPFALLASDISEPDTRFEPELDKDLQKEDVADTDPAASVQPRRRVKVLIKTLGDWTARLEKVPFSTLRLSSAFVQGPIGRIPVDFEHFPQVVLIGAGAGIAPTIGHAQRLLLAARRRQEGATKSSDATALIGKPYKVWVFLIVPFRDMFVPFNNDICTLCNTTSMFSVSCFETGPNGALFNPETHVVTAEEKAIVATDVKIGLPNVNELFALVKEQSLGQKVAVVAAGPKPFERAVINASQTSNFTLHLESSAW